MEKVGLCGLHVIHVHGAFRSAMSETGWDIETEIQTMNILYTSLTLRVQELILSMLCNMVEVEVLFQFV